MFVRLMQEYRLRELFKPSMAELGLCIYQFEYMLQVSRRRQEQVASLLPCSLRPGADPGPRGSLSDNSARNHCQWSCSGRACPDGPMGHCPRVLPGTLRRWKEEVLSACPC